MTMSRVVVHGLAVFAFFLAVCNFWPRRMVVIGLFFWCWSRIGR